MPSLSGHHQNPPLSREDSLEYYIKFPPASTANNFNRVGQHSDGRPGANPSMATTSGDPGDHQQLQHQQTVYDEADCMFMYNETNNVPIVLLLGWAGCQDKYLMKYSKIYEDRG